MKKLILFLVAVCCAAMIQAQGIVNNVPYIDADGVEQTAGNVTEITNASSTLIGGWYVVYGSNVQTGTLVCQDDVHIILADGAKLTATGNDGFFDDIATPGIQVSDTSNSLTIYCQAGQTGQLIANGGYGSAGIGSKQDLHLPTNITINGGIITAIGAVGGAGIGGGSGGEGSHITINGGFVTAMGGSSGSGIGGGKNGTASDIYVDTHLVVKADLYNPPTTVIENDGTDLAAKLKLRPNVTIDPGSLDKVKTDALAAINAAIEGGTDASAIDVANTAKTNITVAETVQEVIYIKTKALTQIYAIFLANARTAAINAIQATANSAKAEIDAASTYKAAKETQDYYKNLIDTTVNTATDSINDATTGAGADKQRSFYTLSINEIRDQALVKIDAIAEIATARQGIKDTDLNNWIDAAINDIQKGSQDATPSIDEIKDQILYMINLFQNGKAEGKTEAFGTLGTKQNGPAVEVIDQDDNSVILYNPKKVNFIKVTSNE